MHRTSLIVAVFAGCLAGCGSAHDSGEQGPQQTAQDKPAADKGVPSADPFREHIQADYQVALSALALSPDGTRVLTGYTAKFTGGPLKFDAADWNVMKLWDTADDGKPLRTFKGHDGGVCMVGFLPDGKRAVSAGGTQVKCWDLETGKELWYAQAYLDRPIGTAAVSPDGQHILTYGSDAEKGQGGSKGGRLKLFSATTGKLVRIYHQFDDSYLERILFSPDSKLACVGAYILDMETGENLAWQATAQNEELGMWAFCPDGRYVSEAREGTDFDNFTYHLTLKEARSGKRVRDFAKKKARIAGFPPAARAVFVSPDGKRVISLDGDGAWRGWDVETGDLLWSEAPEEKGTDFAFSADGRFLLFVYAKLRGYGTEDVQFHFLDADTGKAVKAPQSK